MSNSFFATDESAGTTVEVDFGDEKTVKPKKYAIGYWSIRGLGAPLRMMMFASKTPFTIFLYDIVEKKKEGGEWLFDYADTDYAAAKGEHIKEYNQPLWNLPFCVDRDNERVICQTNAIFAYLGRALNMFGDDDASASECEQLLDEVYDLRNVMVQHAYLGASSKKAAEDAIVAGKKYLSKLEQWLEIQAKKSGKDGKVVHLVNGKYSAPDFHLFEMLDQYEGLAKSIGSDLYGDDDLKRIKEFKDGFENLPENQSYLNSWLHKGLSFNNCIAQFGSLPGPKTYVPGESAKDATWRGKGVIHLSFQCSDDDEIDDDDL